MDSLEFEFSDWFEYEQAPVIGQNVDIFLEDYYDSEATISPKSSPILVPQSTAHAPDPRILLPIYPQRPVTPLPVPEDLSFETQNCVKPYTLWSVIGLGLEKSSF